MANKIDELFSADILEPPADFARRVTALARTVKQVPAHAQSLRPWQWASLGAGTSLGALALCEFVFFAFIAAGAH
jgi:hypothetical protein